MTRSIVQDHQHFRDWPPWSLAWNDSHCPPPGAAGRGARPPRHCIV